MAGALLAQSHLRSGGHRRAEAASPGSGPGVRGQGSVPTPLPELRARPLCLCLSCSCCFRTGLIRFCFARPTREMILQGLAPLGHAEGTRGLIAGAPQILRNIPPERERVAVRNRCDCAKSSAAAASLHLRCHLAARPGSTVTSVRLCRQGAWAPAAQPPPLPLPDSSSLSC